MGIIGILAAIAVPAYNNYKDDAKWGVTDSIIQTLNRTIQINQSLGKNSTKSNTINTVKTKGENLHTNELELQPATILEDTTTQYCIQINKDPDEHNLVAGCGGQTVDVAGETCTQAEVDDSTEEDCTSLEDIKTPGTFKFNVIKGGTCTSDVCE